MKNTISNSVPILISQAQGALPGVIANEATLNLVLINKDSFALNISDLGDARDGHFRAKKDLDVKRTAFELALDEACRFGMVAKGVVNVFLGTEHSPAHALAGFESDLRVRRNLVGITRVLQGLKTHFTDNPTHENAALNVTAARATTLLTNLNNARADVNQQKSKVRELMNTRDVLVHSLRRDLRVLLGELRVKLDPLAPKWEEFGFKRPGAMEIPEVPENVIVVSLVADGVSVKWDAAERAQNYRVWKKVIGVDEDFVAVGTVSDLDHIIAGLPSGATVQIAVSATNTGGESARSAVVTVVTV
jgi:hypothetical protein